MKKQKRTILPPVLEVQGPVSMSSPEVQREATVSDFKDRIEREYAPEKIVNINLNVTFRGLGSLLVHLPSGKTKHLKFTNDNGHSLTTNDPEVIEALDKLKYQRS